MFKNPFRVWFWRRNRLKHWKHRLTTELETTSQGHPLGVPVDLHVSWGPFFNGSAWLNHKRNKAAIYVQIPYDSHLTTDDQAIITEYQLTVRKLPQFIVNHEYFHLLDAQVYNDRTLKKVIRERQKQAQSSTNYHQLLFEEQADRFALARFRENIEKAC